MPIPFQNENENGSKTGTVSPGGFAPTEGLLLHPGVRPTVEDQMWEKLKLHADVPETSPAKRLALSLGSSRDNVISSRTMLEWAKKPFPYQLEGIVSLLKEDACCWRMTWVWGKLFRQSPR